MEQTSTPILLLTGYLGSGKTTLLNHILHNREGIRFAVIVNDIGEVNIDARMIARGGVVGAKDDSLVALQNGCICCTLKMDLVEQIYDLMAMKRFDYIVIEASGICEPEPIARTICSIPYMDKKLTQYGVPRLDCVVTVVDSLRMKDEFGCGDALKGTVDEEDIESLVIQQIEFCNIVLLNKVSEVTALQLDRIREVVEALNPSAEIIECDYCNVPLDRLLDTHMFNFGQATGAATWVKELERPLAEIEHEEHEEEEHHHHHHHDHHHDHHHHDEGEAEEYGIQTFVYYRRPAFDLTKFDNFIARHWPRNVIRAKGVCYFSDNRDMSYLFEQAGRQFKLQEAGQWYATATPEEIARFMEEEPGLRNDWDEHYGDRMEKIVFIGRNLDRCAITAALDACLVP